MELNDFSRAKLERKLINGARAGPPSPNKTKTIGGVMLKQGRKACNHRWELRGCPRCQGDVFLDSEDGDSLAHCLQCGFVGLTGEAGNRP